MPNNHINSLKISRFDLKHMFSQHNGSEGKAGWSIFSNCRSKTQAVSKKEKETAIIL